MVYFICNKQMLVYRERTSSNLWKKIWEILAQYSPRFSSDGKMNDLVSIHVNDVWPLKTGQIKKEI